MIKATSPAAKSSPMQTEAISARDTSTSALISKAVTSPIIASKIIGTPHKIIATQAMSKGKKSSMPVRLQIRAMPEITRNAISFFVPPISSKCSNFSINAFIEALRSIPYGVWVYNTVGGIGLSSGQKKKAVCFNCFSQKFR